MSNAIRNFILLALVAVLLTLAGCQAAALPAADTPPAALARVPTSSAEVPRITPQQLKAQMDAGADVIVVDSRTQQEYNAARIPDSVSLPLPQMPQRFNELPQDKDIVFYCT